MPALVLTPAQQEALVSAMSQRVAEVRIRPAVQPREPPTDALGRLFDKLPAEPPAEAFSVTHDGEAFHSESLRSAFKRAYLAAAAAEGALVGHLRRISSWTEPRVTGVYLASYATLWWLDLLAAAIFALVLARLLRPKLFDAPIWSPWTLHKPKRLTEETVQTAEELGDEVGDLVAGGLGEPGVGASAAAKASMPPQATSVEPGAVMPAPVVNESIRRKVERVALPAQVGAGNFADMHERVANLFMDRGVDDATRKRLAVPLVGLLLLFTFVPTRLIMRGTTAVFAFMFFVISPLSTRYPTLAHALDPNATLLRGLPTNAQLALQALRADPSIIERVAAAEEPSAQVEAGEKPTNKQRFASLVKSTMDLTERSATFFSNENSMFSSNTNDSKKATQHSFLAVYGIVPGHIVVSARTDSAPAQLAFKTGIALGNKPRRELVTLPISQIRAVRKTNGIAAVGLSAALGVNGVGEGIEIDDAEGKVRLLRSNALIRPTISFLRCYRRNALFLRILASDDNVWVIA